MTGHVLTAPREAESLIARTFSAGNRCRISVREEIAFPDSRWLDLGAVTLFSDEASVERLVPAVRRGAYEWKLPDLATTRAELMDLLTRPDQKHEAVTAKLQRSLDAIAAISVRIGLQHPKFDPGLLEAIPFRRSTTIVSDTSGALQGGLDFVARYLYPVARIKIPAIVQVEIVNFADRFFKQRRAPRTKPADLLIDHLVSQGGQRVLLRLELAADTEIERTFLLGDPLRSAFQHDNDLEIRDLNLSVSIRGYADRLILESARQHQAQSNPGHNVQLLTSDQGLARMALAEGLAPLYFQSVVAQDLFGKRLSGTTLHPFSGRLCEVSMVSLLWELATAFGSLRLSNESTFDSLVVSAIGQELSWSPYQSHGDLLWCIHSEVTNTSISHSSNPNKPLQINIPGGAYQEGQAEASAAVRTKSGKERVPTSGARPDEAIALATRHGVSFQRFNVNQLFGLIDMLDNLQTVPEDDVVKGVGARNRDGLEEYRRFLNSAGLIEFDGVLWRANAKLQALAVALRHEDVDQVRLILSNAPSFEWFSEGMSQLRPGETFDVAELKRAVSTYRIMGEVVRICAPIVGEGLYPTFYVPNVYQFAGIALKRFRELDRGEGLVATGAWLEELIRRDGIHPEVARTRLNDASAMKLVRRSTEGSTTEVRFDDHVIQVLRAHQGQPVVETVHLYRGDYLIPGKSSTSLQMEGPEA